MGRKNFFLSVWNFELKMPKMNKFILGVVCFGLITNTIGLGRNDDSDLEDVTAKNTYLESLCVDGPSTLNSVSAGVLGASTYSTKSIEGDTIFIEGDLESDTLVVKNSIITKNIKVEGDMKAKSVSFERLTVDSASITTVDTISIDVDDTIESYNISSSTVTAENADIVNLNTADLYVQNALVEDFSTNDVQASNLNISTGEFDTLSLTNRTSTTTLYVDNLLETESIAATAHASTKKLNSTSLSGEDHTNTKHAHFGDDAHVVEGDVESANANVQNFFASKLEVAGALHVPIPAEIKVAHGFSAENVKTSELNANNLDVANKLAATSQTSADGDLEADTFTAQALWVNSEMEIEEKSTLIQVLADEAHFEKGLKVHQYWINQGNITSVDVLIEGSLTAATLKGVHCELDGSTSVRNAIDSSAINTLDLQTSYIVTEDITIDSLLYSSAASFRSLNVSQIASVQLYCSEFNGIGLATERIEMASLNSDTVAAQETSAVTVQSLNSSMESVLATQFGAESIYVVDDFEPQTVTVKEFVETENFLTSEFFQLTKQFEELYQYIHCPWESYLYMNDDLSKENDTCWVLYSWMLVSLNDYGLAQQQFGDFGSIHERSTPINLLSYTMPAQVLLGLDGLPLILFPSWGKTMLLHCSSPDCSTTDMYRDLGEIEAWEREQNIPVNLNLAGKIFKTTLTYRGEERLVFTAKLMPQISFDYQKQDEWGKVAFVVCLDNSCSASHVIVPPKQYTVDTTTFFASGNWPFPDGRYSAPIVEGFDGLPTFYWSDIQKNECELCHCLSEICEGRRVQCSPFYCLDYVLMITPPNTDRHLLVGVQSQGDKTYDALNKVDTHVYLQFFSCSDYICSAGASSYFVPMSYVVPSYQQKYYEINTPADLEGLNTYGYGGGTGYFGQGILNPVDITIVKGLPVVVAAGLRKDIGSHFSAVYYIRCINPQCSSWFYTELINSFETIFSPSVSSPYIGFHSVSVKTATNGNAVVLVSASQDWVQEAPALFYCLNEECSSSSVVRTHPQLTTIDPTWEFQVLNGSAIVVGTTFSLWSTVSSDYSTYNLPAFVYLENIEDNLCTSTSGLRVFGEEVYACTGLENQFNSMYPWLMPSSTKYMWVPLGDWETDNVADYNPFKINTNIDFKRSVHSPGTARSSNKLDAVKKMANMQLRANEKKANAFSPKMERKEAPVNPAFYSSVM